MMQLSAEPQQTRYLPRLSLAFPRTQEIDRKVEDRTYHGMQLKQCRLITHAGGSQDAGARVRLLAEAKIHAQ